MFRNIQEAISFFDGLKPYLKTRIMGQDHVIEAVSEKLRYWFLSINAPDRPTTFFFLGPTGTGKTEIVRELINYIYGDPGKLLRIDMSEFGNTAGSDVGRKLLGQSSGEPGRLYEFLEKNHEGAILYDEFEKANPEIAKYMLQQIDAGRITLWNNKTYDISRFLLFFTSNVGAEIFQGNKHLTMERKVSAAIQRLKDQFGMPEFIARFGKFNYGIFAFNALTPEILRQITRKFVEDKLKFLASIRTRAGNGFFIPPNFIVTHYSDAVIELALQQTNTTKNGAREIRDIVDRMLNSVYDRAISDNPSANEIVADLDAVSENGITRITINTKETKSEPNHY